MKIARSLLRQLIELKGLKKDKMELVSIFKCASKLKEDEKTIKIIFIPTLFSNNENVLEELKKKIKPNHSIIIVNIFCFMKFPNKVY